MKVFWTIIGVWVILLWCTERRAKQKSLNEKLFKQLKKINPNTLYTNGNGHLILVGPSVSASQTTSVLNTMSFDNKYKERAL